MVNGAVNRSATSVWTRPRYMYRSCVIDTFAWSGKPSSARTARHCPAKSATSRLELIMRFNQVDELLATQRHNLLQAESGPRILALPSGPTQGAHERVRAVRP